MLYSCQIYGQDKAEKCLVYPKERVHSEMKISYKIKLDPSIMPFAFFFSKNVSIPSDINSSPKIPLPGPALSLPGTCIITSRDLHYCFRLPALMHSDLYFYFQDLHYHFQDLHYYFRTCIIYRNLSVMKNKTNGKK